MQSGYLEPGSLEKDRLIGIIVLGGTARLRTHSYDTNQEHENSEGSFPRYVILLQTAI